ncbi:TPA: LPXTG cell wall anchor domain-containing protein [Candidatus Gracilibacteria bacterium]|nr:LPXTG cell wall anchor domain-containing protein [Candidatus Gracilibacteria bacterium]HIQ57133.1 LPXTG cell wall anchor domain-containing protein [Candidatus Gracilibacteria bacterium]
MKKEIVAESVSSGNINSFIIIGGLMLLLIILIFWLRKKQEQNKQRTILQKVVDAVLLPVNFGALFLENRKIEQLPFYYRWFLKFIQFTAQIHYFHFLPKAIIAIAAEWIIFYFTGQNVLTAIVFSWSILFLILMSMVEGQNGEMNEDTIIFANKLFLYTVSMLMVFSLISYFLFWDKGMSDYFISPFFIFMGDMAHKFNELLLLLFQLFMDSSVIIKSAILFILVFYIGASIYSSRKIK